MRRNPYFIGVDAGTGSVRAGVFNKAGDMLGTASRPISIWKPQEDFVEQSSDDIWMQTTSAARDAVAAAQIVPDDIAAIGFDATCSLVALDKDGVPVSVSPTGRNEQNVIVWMDHRAQQEATEMARLGVENRRLYMAAAVMDTVDVPVSRHRQYNEAWPIIEGTLPITDTVIGREWPSNHLGFVYGDHIPALIELSEQMGIGYKIWDSRGNAHTKAG